MSHSPRKFLTVGQKKDIVNFVVKNEDLSYEKIATLFTENFGFFIHRKNVKRTINARDEILKISSKFDDMDWISYKRRPKVNRFCPGQSMPNGFRPKKPGVKKVFENGEKSPKVKNEEIELIDLTEESDQEEATRSNFTSDEVSLIFLEIF